MTAILSRSLSPPAPGDIPGNRDLALEGFRGLCALLVLYGHMFSPIPCLDPVYSPSDKFWWLDMGSVAVLAFFVLSGYVIGLTVKSPYSGAEARGYLGRRFLRLVPVNTAAVIISWALAPRVGRAVAMGNLAFLQNFNPYLFGLRVPVMDNNPSLWTLNFEVCYYLLFLVVWRFAPRMGIVFFSLAVVTVAAVVDPSLPQFISCYAAGGLYWFAGLSVAWLAPRDTKHGNWPSALLVAAVMWRLAPFWAFTANWHIADLSVPPVSLRRLDLLPICLWALLALTGRAQKWHRRLAIPCLVMVTLALARRFSTGDYGDIGHGAMVAYAVTAALAWCLIGWRPAPSILVWMAPVGLISYGLYAVSLALQFGILGARFLPSGSGWSYSLRCVLLIGLSLGIAYMLERRLQPWLRRRLTSPRRAAAPPQTA